jgi:hypothetical protein
MRVEISSKPKRAKAVFKVCQMATMLTFLTSKVSA